LLAVDLHPDYISTRTARLFPGIPVVQVQHHHAHIASCMAEHHLDEKVIGIALDGTGYGDDGHTWGGEFLLCDLLDYTRVTHFEYMPLPGGDMAAEEPWRMAVSYLYKIFGTGFMKLDLPLFRQVDADKIKTVVKMIDRDINCPLTSGAGRLFDAVASLLGLCQTASFQAEGPMRLESLVQPGCSGTYGFHMDKTIRFDTAIRGIIEDLRINTDVKIIASKFHNTIISVIFETANAIREREGINKAVLSGGVFQNKYLLEGTLAILRKNNFEVFAHSVTPSNDGGIALGQLAVASKRRTDKCV
ncbi:MAG: carbamoyltransferase HypF, partial [Bacteroidota bacterium]